MPLAHLRPWSAEDFQQLQADDQPPLRVPSQEVPFAVGLEVLSPANDVGGNGDVGGRRGRRGVDHDAVVSGGSSGEVTYPSTRRNMVASGLRRRDGAVAAKSWPPEHAGRSIESENNENGGFAIHTRGRAQTSGGYYHSVRDEHRHRHSHRRSRHGSGSIGSGKTGGEEEGKGKRKVEGSASAFNHGSVFSARVENMLRRRYPGGERRDYWG